VVGRRNTLFIRALRGIDELEIRRNRIFAEQAPLGFLHFNSGTLHFGNPHCASIFITIPLVASNFFTPFTAAGRSQAPQSRLPGQTDGPISSYGLMMSGIDLLVFLRVIHSYPHTDSLNSNRVLRRRNFASRKNIADY
tara:strand:- start:179 stop:592 length:414 start_codon:yes stop_codon:yes gene_type:complete